jgi:hypothetical protein
VKHVQIRLEDGEYAEFKRKAQLAGLDSVQEAGKIAVLNASWETGPDADVPPKYRPCLKMLAEVLASGDEDLIELVIRPLEFARKRLRASDGQQKAGKQNR